jgi:hypothetical protein
LVIIGDSFQRGSGRFCHAIDLYDTATSDPHPEDSTAFTASRRAPRRRWVRRVRGNRSLRTMIGRGCEADTTRANIREPPGLKRRNHVDPNANVSGSTSVWCSVVGFVNGSFSPG